MWIGIVSLFPELIETASAVGVTGRALRNGVARLEAFNPRDFTSDKHQTVDDRPYGGGPGMVMMVEPLLRAVDAARQRAAAQGLTPRVIMLSPQGQVFNQTQAGRLADPQALILVAGRYEGVDQRFLDTVVDEELSVGDYVVSGGELPALLVVDAVLRLLPGTLGNSESAVAESHLDGLLDYPQYTRPENLAGHSVPEVLLSGDHRAVGRWRRQQALHRTWLQRPDLLAARRLTDSDRELLAEMFADEENDGAKKQDH